MQRILGLFLVLMLVVGSMIYFRQKSGSEQTLNILTWSNYFPESVIESFSKETGIKVSLNYFSSNEELFAKLKAGATGFDIIQPSDYMVRQMIKAGMLQALERPLLTGINNLEPFYLNPSYDPGNTYSVPFTWGTTGLAINTKKVKLSNTNVSWKLLTQSPHPKQTSLLDDMREVFGVLLFQRGISPNEKNVSVLNGLKPDLRKLKDGVLMFTSEPKPLLLKEELTIAHIYSVDAVQAQMEKPEIRYFIPEEGAMIWTDNFAIPKSALHSKEAHLFINYFLNPDNALKIITENHLATPNLKAREKLPKNVLENPALYPNPEVMKRLHFLEDIGDTQNSISQIWTELKS